MQERFRIQCIHDMNSSISANLNTAQQRSWSVSSAPTCQNVQQHSSGLRCVSHLICVNRWLCFFSFSRHSHGHTLRPRHIFHFVLGRIGSQLHVDAIHGLVSKPYAHVSSQADRDSRWHDHKRNAKSSAHGLGRGGLNECHEERNTVVSVALPFWYMLLPLIAHSYICFFVSGTTLLIPN